MSDEPATDVEYRESVHDGLIELGFTPLSGGKLTIWVDYTPDGDTESVLRRTVPRAVFTEPTPKGKFLNDAESALTAYETINETAARNELREALDEIGQQGREQQVEMMDPELRPLIENTEFPVRIYADGDETTFEVDTTFKGNRGTLEFTGEELNSKSGAALETKITNTFFKLVDIESEDWQDIREHWTAEENTEVVYANQTSPAEALAERVLSMLRTSSMPVSDPDNLENDVASVWLDTNNEVGYDGADDNEIVWVSGDHLIDELESAGKKVEYKGQLVKSFISMNAVYGPAIRKQLGGAKQRFYPFKPDAIDISRDDVATPEPENSEIEA